MTKIWKHRRVIGLILALIMMFQIEIPVGVTAASDSGSNTELLSGTPAVQDEEEDSGDTGEETTPGIEDAAQGDDSEIPAGSEGEDGTEEPGTSEEGEDGAKEPGTSEEGEDGAEEPGTPAEGEGGAEEPETSEEGEDGAEKPGTSEEGIEEPETENTGNVDTTPVISEDTAALLAGFIEMLATLPTADGSLNQEEYDQVVVAYNKYSAVYSAFMTDNGDGSFDFDEYLLSTYEGAVENFYALLATPMTTDEPVEADVSESGGLTGITVDNVTKGSEITAATENITIHLFNYGKAINPGYYKTRGDTALDVEKVLQFADEQPSALDGKTWSTSNAAPKMEASLQAGYPAVENYDGLDINGGQNIRSGSLEYLFDTTKGFVDANGDNHSAVVYNPVTNEYSGEIEASYKNLTQNDYSNYQSQHYVVANDGTGTGLFQRDDDGYLFFDSADNFAWYNKNTQKFELYNFALRPYWGGAENRGKGHFLPFNSVLTNAKQLTDSDAKLKYGTYSGNNWTCDNEQESQMQNATNVTQNIITSNIGGLNNLKPNVWVLPYVTDTDSKDLTPRRERADYWYGMSVEFEFYMPKDGKIGTKAMIFDFLGDDDVWVYIDDRLVLDLGGTGTSSGNIDFSTGVVKKGTTETYIKQYFTNNGKTDGAVLTDDNNKPIAEFQELQGNSTFANYTKHTLKFFYLERGGGSCNCRLRFNMPTLPDKSLTVTKELTSDNESVGDFIKNSVPYQFRVVKAVDGKATDELYITPGTEYDILEGTTTVATGVVDENGYFTIKGGQSALFTKMLEKASDDGNTSYIVEEIIPDNVSGQYGGVEYSIDGTPGTITTEDKGQSEFTTYQTGALDATAAQVVAFKNKVTTSNLSTLKITKKIAAGSNLDEKNTYRMRVTLGGVQLAKGTEYRINGETNTVSDDGCVVLKAGETAVISGILSGTKYVIEEQDVEKNKYRVTYEGKETVGAETKNLTFDNAANAANGTVKTSSTTDITITNATYDFSGSIPISKQYLGNGSETKTFQFNIEQVDENGNTIDGAEQLPGTSITVTNADATAGSIVIGYKTGTAGTFYYKVSETVGSDDKKQIFYDHSVYYVTMEVKGEAAKVIDVKKHGDESYSWEPQDVLPFVNRSVVRLTIDKTVTGNMGDINRAFPFDISISIGTEPYVTGTLYCYQNGALIQLNYNNQSENYTFNLPHNQSIQLLVPYGCNYTLSENMKAEWKYDSTTFIVDTKEPKVYNNPISAVEISNENLTAAQTISVTNHKEGIPDTGISLDSMPYILVLALAVIGVAIFIIFKRKRRDDD